MCDDHTETSKPRVTPAETWPDAELDLVVSVTGGPRLLVVSVALQDSPELSRILRALRAGGAQPCGTTRWIPEWQSATLTALRLRASLHDPADPAGAVTDLRLRCPLPRMARTLSTLPQRVAVTDPLGFLEMQRTRALPCAVLLPPAGTEVLAEHLPSADAA